MGAQQLLLTLLSVIVIGFAIVVGIDMFRDHTAATNRDAVANDLVHAASYAQLYKRKPKIQGGGGGSFIGFRLESVFKTLKNTNGSYSILGSATDSAVVFEGLGTQSGYDNTTLVKVTIKVYAENVEVVEVN